ncbi:hypothetical protein VT84_11555 [Gemmata sp. SH-PL17]|uniref:hypothetical protein n=1 Tax=Gemmata sp. SH-PL17 TaxID=1630693 RepID=UPI00078D7B2C|nr:hypothetical protein [Gemmata sp. SH-PL17]AMV25025.1 hypothetical protein VT84_11555 [Gemmata sp. SH-PL17]
MNRRYIILSGLFALAAVAAGCTPLRGSRPDATVVPPPYGKSAFGSSDKPGSGGVIQAGATEPGEPVVGANKFELTGGQPVGYQSSPPGQPLAQPRPTALPPANLPPVPGATGHGTGTGTGSAPPVTAPGAPGNPAAPGAPGNPVTPGTGVPGGPGVPGAPNPNVLPAPTVYGKTWNLGPNEVPTDRVVELTRQLELVFAQNRELVARIKELENQGLKREQALVEAMREVEAAQAEVDKARGIISTQKSDITALQEKIRQLEREDIEMLKLMIGALEKLLPPARREP